MCPQEVAHPSSFPLLYFLCCILTSWILIFLFPAYKLEQVLCPLHTTSPDKQFKIGINPWDSLELLPPSLGQKGKCYELVLDILWLKKNNKLLDHVPSGNIFISSVLLLWCFFLCLLVLFCFVFSLVFQVRFKVEITLTKIYPDSKRSWKWKWRKKLLQKNIFFQLAYCWAAFHTPLLWTVKKKQENCGTKVLLCSENFAALCSEELKADFWSGASKRFSDLQTPACLLPSSCAQCFSFKAAGALWTWHLQQAQGRHAQHCLQKEKLLVPHNMLLAPEIKGQRGACSVAAHARQAEGLLQPPGSIPSLALAASLEKRLKYWLW